MDDQHRTLSLRIIAQVLFFIVVVPFLPLLISRRWGWWEAWVYALICIVGFAASRGMAAKRHPDLLAERARFMQHEDTVSWDKILAPLTGLGGGLIPVVAGLDAAFGWSPAFGLPVKVVSLVVILAGYILGSYALIENRYFSGVVRLQIDRGHKVVSSGPYGWVRHPGYTGALLTYLVTPLFLDALWAFVSVVFVIIVLVIRTKLEDETLKERLESYRDYARRVRYRLVPGVW